MNNRNDEIVGVCDEKCVVDVRANVSIDAMNNGNNEMADICCEKCY